MPDARARLASVEIGGRAPVAVMGVINVSPESFHPGSVYGADRILRVALEMVDAGAVLVDVGARSTAPYLATEITEAEESDRLARAVERLADKLPVPVSADTARPAVARAALQAGARVLNDVSGLADPALAREIAAHDASLITMAAPGPGRSPGAPIATVRAVLGEALARAGAAGIPEERIAVDPGIGFFREGAVAWHEWDVAVLRGLAALHALGRPICVGVSRKSFIGALTGRTATEDRLSGSLAATTAAVLNGAALIRAHDVRETLDAVRVAERLRAPHA
jgi:dihydropteroate synthase